MRITSCGSTEAHQEDSRDLIHNVQGLHLVALGMNIPLCFESRNAPER